MADLSGFDASQVEPSRDFEPIPNGKYNALIIDSAMKPNKSATGEYLELTFEIQDGPNAKRLLWSRLNLDHPNEKAVQIAKGELSAICRAVGVLNPRDSVDLHNLPLIITVKCKKRKDTEELVNEISGFSKKESAVPAPSANGQAIPPWKKSA